MSGAPFLRYSPRAANSFDANGRQAMAIDIVRRRTAEIGKMIMVAT
jgi:hypothetical protein